MVRRGATLTEILTVVGIIVILLGASLAGLSALLRQYAPQTGMNTIRTVHMTLQGLARQQPRSGRIYGYSLLTGSSNSNGGTASANVDRPAFAYLVPWYIEPTSTTATYFTNDTANANYKNLRLLPTELESAMANGSPFSTPTNCLYYELKDTLMISSLATPEGSNYRNYWRWGRTLTTWPSGSPLNATIGLNRLINFCFEPGSGLLHASLPTASAPPGEIIPGSSTLSLKTLVGDGNQSGNSTAYTYRITLNFFNTTTWRPMKSLVLHQYGAVEVRGAQ